jgi:decaprenylphospho-beta-D-erythro-pentofuranosid-2-ulose 2-reductase
MNALIVGASSGLGRALAVRFAQTGCNVVLVAREGRDLNAIACDLSVRFGVKAIAVAVDVMQSNWLDEVAHAGCEVGPLDVLATPIGAVFEGDDPSLEGTHVERLLRVNFLAVCECVQRFWPQIAAQKGVVVGFGSIAAARGRSTNASYAAAKRALESWFESLRHFGATQSVRVQFYICGYLDTSLAYGMGLKFPKGDPSAFALEIVQNLDKDFGVRHYPAFWRYMCGILGMVPWFIYKRLSF